MINAFTLDRINEIFNVIHVVRPTKLSNQQRMNIQQVIGQELRAVERDVEFPYYWSIADQLGWIAITNDENDPGPAFIIANIADRNHAQETTLAREKFLGFVKNTYGPFNYDEFTLLKTRQ